MTVPNIITIVVSLVPFIPVFSQTVHQESYWLRVYARRTFQEKWSWHLEADERRLIQPDRQLQFIMHGHIHRKIGTKMELSAGASYSVVNNLPERRLFQEVHFRSAIRPKWYFSSRFRTEQRWLKQADNTWLLRYRGRVRVQLEYDFWKNWRVKLGDEFMWQSGQFEQNRFFFAIEYAISKLASLEIGYIKLQQKQKLDSCIDRDVLRTTCYLNF